MNMENQKKWFIYVGDHHEGPFTPDEVFEKQKAGITNDESFVWCEGMGDWQALTQVSELFQELQKRRQREVKVKTEGKAEPKTENRMSAKIDASPNQDSSSPTETHTRKNNGKKIAITLGAGIFVLFALSLGTLAVLSRSSSDEFHSTLRPTLTKMVDRFSFLSGMFKLIPSLNDVKSDELKELEQAAIGVPDLGVKIAIALSIADPNRPFFYISSNLPHKTKFDFYLIGNNETLLNKLQLNTQTTATLHFGFGKTEVVSSDGGQPLPKGEYQVYVTEANDQDESIKSLIASYPPNRANVPLPVQIPNGSHFLYTKTFFLGGERDQTYLTRLKAFHDKVKQNADKEMTELKQYSDTLFSQFSTFTGDFNKIYNAKKATPVMKLNWKKNSETWLQINNQLEQTIQTWTKETLQNEFFYGKAYELVKSSYESMKKLFTMESAYIEKPEDKNTFEIQHGKALSEVREANDLLKAKIDLIFNAPKSPSGLPTRE